MGKILDGEDMPEFEEGLSNMSENSKQNVDNLFHSSNIVRVFCETYMEHGGQPEEQFYIDFNGSRIDCSEDTIDRLWWQWVMNPGAGRYFDGKYVVFESPEVPLDLDKDTRKK